MLEAREQLAQDLKRLEIDPCKEEAVNCSKSTHKLIEAWHKTKGDADEAATKLKQRLADLDVFGSVVPAITLSKLTRVVLVELRITTKMLRKTKRGVAQLGHKRVTRALKSVLEKALQQLKGEAAALKKRLTSGPDALRILKEARQRLVHKCKVFMSNPGGEAWKGCTAWIRNLLASWAGVRRAITAAVEELRGKTRDKDLLEGTNSAVVLACLLRGAISELLELMKALGEMKEQAQAMEGALKAVVEVAIKQARDEIKTMQSELKEVSADQILQGAELQQLRAEAAVDGGEALLDFADMVLSGVSIVPGLSGVCGVLKGVVGAGRKVHELAEDALKMTESAFEIGRYLIDMERMAMRMEEGRKAELQYYMNSLSELVGDMQEAIGMFGERGVITKMLTSAKLARKVITIERRKEATLQAMDRILQTVQTELMLDAKDRVQLDTKEHTYALAEAVWAKMEEHTRAKGGDVDLEADVSEAAEEIMRDSSALQEVADRAGLSEEVAKEEMVAVMAVVGKGFEQMADTMKEEAGQTRETLKDGFEEIKGILSARAVAVSTAVLAASATSKTVAVFCCHTPHATGSCSIEVAGAARLEGEKKVLANTEGARILSPASIQSMNNVIAESNPRGVHIAGHNQYIIDQMRIVGFSSLGICDSDSDEENALINECSPELLAEYIVDPALTNGTKCQLEVVVLNACHSLRFAQALMKRAAVRSIKLQVTYWPGPTDDRMCRRYSRGYYTQKQLCDQRDDVGWVQVCHEAGLRQVRMKKLQLDPELLRGAAAPGVHALTEMTMPALLSEGHSQLDVGHPDNDTEEMPLLLLERRAVGLPSRWMRYAWKADSKGSSREAAEEYPMMEDAARAKGTVKGVGAKESGAKVEMQDAKRGAKLVKWASKETKAGAKGSRVKTAKGRKGRGAAKEQANVAPNGDNEWAALVELLLVDPGRCTEAGVGVGVGVGAGIYLEEEVPIVDASKGPTEAVDEMEWTVALGSSGDGSFDRLREDPQFQEQVLTDLSSVTGDGSASVRLGRGSIVAYITSPPANFKAARIRSVASGMPPLVCAGLEVTDVAPARWMIVDMEVWRNAGEPACRWLATRFSDRGLGHLLELLMPSVHKGWPMHALLLNPRRSVQQLEAAHVADEWRIRIDEGGQTAEGGNKARIHDERDSLVEPDGEVAALQRPGEQSTCAALLQTGRCGHLFRRMRDRCYSTSLFKALLATVFACSRCFGRWSFSKTNY
jgi:hypothetical protein